MSLLTDVVVRPSGEAAVVLELGDGIDPAVHERVLALDEAITRDPPSGLVEVVPTYRSVLLRLDPARTTPDRLVAALRDRDEAPRRRHRRARVHDVPVSFTPADAEDLRDVAERAALPVEEVLRLLTTTRLRVYCHGFAPGFAYLGGVPDPLHLPRRATPRHPVAPGAVLLAAGQAALCPTAMPTGWWVVGRTDVVLFDPTDSTPVPFAPGDELRLVRS